MDCELFVIFELIYDSSNITYANTLVLRLCKLTKNCNNDALVTLSSLKIQEPISSTYIQMRIRELWIRTVPSHLLQFVAPGNFARIKNNSMVVYQIKSPHINTARNTVGHTR